jgi:hypothetical protein
VADVGARAGGGRRLVVVVKKRSELRDRKDTSRALLRAGHDKSGVVIGAAAAATHERSKNACVEEGHRLQVHTDARGATLESGLDALTYLRGGGEIVFASQSDRHVPWLSRDKRDIFESFSVVVRPGGARAGACLTAAEGDRLGRSLSSLPRGAGRR